MTKADKIELTFPNFYTNVTIGQINVTDHTNTYSDSDLNSTWTAGTNTLLVKPETTFPAGTQHNVTIYGLALPSAGVVKDSSAAITVFIRTDKSDVNDVEASPSTIRSVPGIGIFTTPVLQFSSSATMGQATDITFTTTLGPGGFQVGDAIVLYLSIGFTHSTSADAALALYDNSGAVSISTIWSAAYSSSSNTITYTCLTAQTTSFAVSTFIPSSSGITLPTTVLSTTENFHLKAKSTVSPVAHFIRIPDGSHSSVGAMVTAYPTMTYTPTLLEDTGAYDLTFTLKAANELVQNDVVYLILPSYTGTTFSASSVTGTWYSLAHALTLSWKETGTTVTSGGITYTCDSSSTPCLKVVIGAMTITANSEFAINVPTSKSLSIPATGVSTVSSDHGIVAFAQIASGNINTEVEVTNGACSGFCTANIHYDSLSSGDASTINVDFSLSTSIAIGEYVEFYLPNFTGVDVPSLTLTVTNSAFTGAWNLGTKKLRITATSNVVASTVVTLVVATGQIGLPAATLTGNCATEGLTISTNAAVFAASSSSTVLTRNFIGCENLLLLGSFSSTSFVFNPTTAGEEADITVAFTISNFDLTPGDSVEISYAGNLEWFQGTKSNVTLSGPDHSEFDATLATSNTLSKITLTKKTGNTITAGTSIQVILDKDDNHIKVPVLGILSTSTPVSIKATTADRFFTSTTVATVSAVPSFSSSKIISYEPMLPNTGATNVTLQFSLRNTILAPGDNVTFTFTGFSYAEQLDKVNITCAIWVTPTCQDFRPSWDAATSQLRLTARQTITTVQTLTYMAKFPGAGLVIPAVGLIANSPQTLIGMTFEEGSAYPHLTPIKVASSPCVGVCSTAVSFDVGQAGLTAAVNLDISTSIALRTGDAITMNMNNLIEGPDIASLTLEGTDGKNFTGVYNGAGDKILTLTCSSNAKKNNLRVTLARSNVLNIPSAGIVSGRTFAVTATAPGSFGSVSSTAAPSSATAVGALLQSSLKFDLDGATDPADNHIPLAGKASALQFLFRFSSMLQPYEQINIYLPEFTSDTTGAINMRTGLFPGLDTDEFTASWSPTASTITLTLDPLALLIPANTVLNFTIADNQIKLPSAGIALNTPTLLVSTNSVDGAVASNSISSTPAVGAALTSKINFYRGKNQTDEGKLDNTYKDLVVSPGNPVGIRFTTAFNLDLNQNDQIKVVLPGFIHPDEASLTIGSYHGAAVADYNSYSANLFTGSWAQSTTTLTLVCNVAGGCSSTTAQPLTIDVTEPNGFISPKDGFPYGGSASSPFTITTSSATVPISETKISDVAGMGFHEFSLTYAPLLPSTVVASGEDAMLNIEFRLSFNMVLEAGDNVTCHLPNFAVSSSDAATKEVIEVHGDPNFDFTHAFYDEATSSLSVKVNGTVSHSDGRVGLKVKGLALPSSGISTAESQLITCGATSLKETIQSPAFNFSAPLTTIQTLGSFTTSTISFTPRVSGEDTTITAAFSINSPLKATETVTLYLPLFTASSTVSLDASSFSPVDFTLSWDAATSMLTMTPASDIASPGTAISIAIVGLVLPSVGVSPTGSAISMKTNAAACQVLKLTSPTSIVGVGHFSSNKVSFLPSNLKSTTSIGGSTNRFKLRRGHNIPASEFLNEVIAVGASYADSQFLTVAAVEGDVLVTSELYTGSKVNEKIDGFTTASLPATQVFLPGYRPAYYVYGSENTDGKLTFKYIVQEGDYSSDLALKNAPRAIELLGNDWIRRTSTHPTTAASPALMEPNSAFSVRNTSAVEVDTTTPTVINVTTTKRNGNYGRAGAQIDITVVYTHPVSVYYPQASRVRYSMPAMALNVITSDLTTRYAFYNSGNNTKEITFIYTIEAGDYTANELTYEDPRDIYGVSAITSVLEMNEGYLMRSAVNLVQYANVSLPRPGQVDSFDNLHSIFVNNASSTKYPFVTGIDSLAENGTYGAGEIIDLKVTFSHNITVNLNSGWPYIEMDVGAPASSPRLAHLVDGKAVDNSLTFRYIVKDGDSSLDLDYKCTCADYTMTTYIQLNGTTITDKSTSAGISTEADYSLPSVSTGKNLASVKNIIIDTTAPTVESVSTNTLDGIYGFGEEIEILVKYSATVFVSGTPRLSLGSERGSYAYYRNGNATDTLTFKYVVSSESFHSMADLSYSGGSAAIDLNGGAIKRLSDDPRTDALLALPASGTISSLGYRSNVEIDGTAPYVVSTTASTSATSFYANHQTIDVVAFSRNVTAGQFKIGYNKLSTVCLNYDVSAAEMQTAIENTNALDVQVSEYELGGYKNYGEYGRRYTIEFLNPANGISELYLTLGSADYSGCESFMCTNTTFGEAECPPSEVPTFQVNRDGDHNSGMLDIVTRFSAPVSVSGTPILQIETGPSDARATYAPSSTQVVEVGVTGSAKISFGQFQLKYDGFVTNCIDYASPDSIGLNSMLNRLLEIPKVSAVGINSITSLEKGNGFSYTIEFSSGVDLKQLEPVEYNDSLKKCTQLVPNDARTVVPSVEEITFRYPVSRGSRLTLKATGGNIASGTKVKLVIPSTSGIALPTNGIGTNDHKYLGFSSADNSHKMRMAVPFKTALSPLLGSFTRSSLSFTPNACGTSVGVTAAFALAGQIEINEEVIVELKGFTMTGCLSHPGGVCSGIAKTIVGSCAFDVFFISHNSQLVFRATQVIAAGTQCAVTVAASENIVSSSAAVFADSLSFKIGSNATSGFVTDFPIEETEGMGINRAVLSFGNPKPGEASNINVEIAPTDFVKSGAEINIALPEFSTGVGCTTSAVDLTVLDGYDADYFTASFTCSPSPVLKLVTNRKLHPRLHQLVVEGSASIGGLTIPARGLHPNTNAVTVAISNSDAAYFDVVATPVRDLQKIGSFRDGNLQFSNPFAGERSSFNITFKPDMEINMNETIVYYLPGFSGPSTTSPQISAHDGQNSTFFKTSWENATSTLTLFPLVKLLKTRTYSVDIAMGSRLRLPTAGLASNFAGLVSTNANNGPITGATISSLFPFANIGSVVESKVLFSSSFVNETSSISLEFTTNDNLERGAVVNVLLPGFTCPTSALSVSGADSDHIQSAVWSSVAETLSLTIGGDSSLVYDFIAENWKVEIAATNGFKYPDSGLAMNDQSVKVKVTSTAAPVTKYKRVDMVNGLGFVSSSLEFNPALPGSYSSDITFKFATSKAIKALEIIHLELPDFNTNTSDSEKELVLGGADGGSFSATWLRPANKLKLKALTDIMVRKYEIVVLASNKIRLPIEGVTRNSNAVVLSLASENMGNIVNQPVRHTQGIGAFTKSVVDFSNPVAGEATDVIISFKFSGQLQGSEFVELKLAHFTATSDAISSFTLTGTHASKLVASWRSDTETLRLTVLPTESIGAYEEVNVRVNSQTQLLSPLGGVKKDSTEVVVSSNAGAAAVLLPSKVNVTTAIGAIISNSIRFSPVDVGGLGHFVFEMELNDILNVGDTFQLKLPYFNATVHIPAGGSITLDGVDKLVYSAKWDYRDDLMTFEVLTKPTKTTVDFYVVNSNNFLLADTSIFEGEEGKNGISIKVNSSAVPVKYSKFINVGAGVGFTNASLDFSPLGAGLATDFTLSFKLSGALADGGKIFLQLKTFGGSTQNITTPVITSSTGHTFAGKIENWRNITLVSKQLIPANTLVTVTVLKSNGIKLPASLALTHNDPEMLIWTDSDSVETTPPLRPVSIPHSPGMGFFSASSLAYSHQNLGEVVAITASFTPGVDLISGDKVTLQLDGFGGNDVDAVAFDGSGNAGDFDGGWVGSSGNLVLTANKDLSAGTFSVVVVVGNGIKLPPFSLSTNDSRLKISASAAVGNIHETAVSTSPAVGKFTSSSVEFVKSDSSSEQSINLVLKWSLSGDLAVGEFVNFKLPDFSVSGDYLTEISAATKRYVKLYGLTTGEVNSAFSTHSLDATNDILLSVGGENGDSFVAAFNDNLNVVKLFALEKIYASHRVSLILNFNNGIFLPKVGVKENDENVEVSTNAATSPVEAESVEFVQPIGVVDSSISFDPPVAGATTEITFSVNLTCPMQKGDFINLNMTGFGGPNTGFWQHQIDMSGSDGSRGWKSLFNATWDNTNDILRLESNGLMDDTFVTAIIDGKGNNITLPVDGISESASILMFVSTNCTGELKDIPVNRVPVVGNFVASSFEIDTYTPGKPTDMNLEFELSRTLYEGEEIIFHMEGFGMKADYTVREESSSLYGGGIELGGTHAASFTAEFSTGDVSEKLTLPSLTPFTLSTGSYIRRASTNPLLDADLTFTELDSFAATATIDSTSPAYVTNVYSTTGAGPHNLGQILKFIVCFNKPIATDTTDGNPILLLQFDGKRQVATLKESENTANTLVFTYKVQSEDKTSNLKLVGKFGFITNKCKITNSISGSVVRANTTLPSPFDYLAKEEFGNIPKKMVVSGTTNSISISGVTTESANGLYLAGDIIDINVEFNEEVAVTGSPHLLLRSGVGGTDTKAYYTDAMVTQHFDIGVYASSQTMAGGFMLKYGDPNDASDVGAGNSFCIDWDTVEGSTSGLKERLEAIAHISDNGGVKTVTKTTRGNGNRFEVEFNFANPKVLSYHANSAVFCEQFVPMDASVRFPSSNVVSFRYTVLQDEMDHYLEYSGANALIAASPNGIFASSSRSSAEVSLVLPVPGAATSLSGQHSLAINGTKPEVERVFATPGVYGYGVWVDVSVQFNLPVKVTGSPILKLESGFTDDYAHYLTNSASSSKLLQFRYTVKKEHETLSLNYTDKNSLILLTAADTINALSTLSNLPANLTLPEPKSSDALGASNVKIVIDPTYRAQVMTVSSSTADGYYTEGDEINVSVKFTRIVTVKSLEPGAYPYLVVETGPVDGKGLYTSGSGTDTLQFTYTIGSNDTTFDLNATSFEYNTTLVYDEGGKNASTVFDHWVTYLADNINIAINQDEPRVTDIGSYSPDGVYSAGDEINVYVVFDYDVAVTGNPGVELNVYSREDDQVAYYSSGSGGKVLNFTYVIPFDDISKNIKHAYVHRLDYASTHAMEEFKGDGTIKRNARTPTKDAILHVPSIDISSFSRDHDIEIDSHTPYVLQVRAQKPAGTYGAGEEVLIDVAWSAAVTINGTGSLLLETGDDDFYAPYVSGNNTNTLTYKYTVHPGHAVNALDVVNTNLSPYNCNVRASMALIVSDDPEVVDCPLFPQPTPKLPVIIILRQATNPTMNVNYALPLPGAANSISSLATIKIDSSPATVTRVWTTLGNGTYGIGEVIPIYVDFNYQVSVAGTPVLNMKTNNPEDENESANAIYVSGSTTNSLKFDYEVKYGDKTDLFDYVGVDSLKVLRDWTDRLVVSTSYIRTNSASPITNADLTLPTPGLKPTVISPSSMEGSYHSLKLQTEGLKIVNVVSEFPTGIYSWGEQVPISVELNGAVEVSGIPKLLMDVSVENYAYFVSLSASKTVLNFVYTVATTDQSTDLSYKDKYSLVLDQGVSIKSVAFGATDAVQTLPMPGLEGSLTFNNDIILAGSKPTVVALRYHESDAAFYASGVRFGVGEEIFVYAEFDQVVDVLNGVPTLKMNTDSFAYYASGSGTKILKFSYVVAEGDSSNDLGAIDTEDALVVSGSYQIVSHSSIVLIEADLELPIEGEMGSLSYGNKVVVDTNAVTVKKLTFMQESGMYVAGNLLSIEVEFSDDVAVGGTVVLHLHTGDINSPGLAHFYSGGGLGSSKILFKYGVKSTDVSSDLDYMGIGSLTLDESAVDSNGKRINYVMRHSTSPTQHANLDLPARGSEKSLGRSKNIVLDSTAPVITLVNTTTADGEYTQGDVIQIAVHFSEAVYVDDADTKLYMNSGSDSTATYLSGNGTKTFFFNFLVGEDDVSDKLDLVCSGFCESELSNGIQNHFPVTMKASCSIFSVANGVCASPGVPNAGSIGSVSHAKAIVINQDSPTVVEVRSLEAYTKWGYGVGQELIFEVEFDKKVNVAGVGSVNLTLSTQLKYNAEIGEVGTATYKSGGGSTKLQFTYTVRENDSIQAVEYTSSGALIGSVLRHSMKPQKLAICTLPAPQTSGSISHTKRIILDSARPFVKSVFPMKRPGLYVSGEEIAIVVRFSQPVTVTGEPRVYLNVANGGVSSVGYAQYVKTTNFNRSDVNFDYLATDMVMVYTVGEGDGTISLEHNGTTAFKLNGGDILRSSTTPTTAALLGLRGVDDVEVSDADGLVDGSWMAYYPKKVEVVLRDLWHEHTADLEVTLAHGNASATLLKRPSPSEKIHTFGEGKFFHASMASNLTGEVHEKRRHLDGIGYDYVFGDVVETNVALSGVAKQSSTKYHGHANKAIDGNVDGFYSRDSVSHTGGHGENDPEPWWQVKLEKPGKIGTIRVWNRKTQQSRDEIQVISVVHPNEPSWPEPFGTFELGISMGGVDGSSYRSTAVDARSVGSRRDEVAEGGDGVDVGESMQSKIEAMTGLLGRVAVTRTRTEVYNGGMSGYQYTVTFTGHNGDLPLLSLKSSNFTFTPNANVFFETRRNGVSNEFYNYKNVNVKTDYEKELFPFWIMVFNSSVVPPENIEGGLKEVIRYSEWNEEITEVAQLSTIQPQNCESSAYVRIQFSDYNDNNYLSLAEVEVFESVLSPMSRYTGGSPIAERAVVEPYLAEDSLTERFRNYMYGGVWTLSITDHKVYANSYEGGKLEEMNGRGTFNDFVLVITDQTNTINRYYMETQALVKTLPKYGQLLVKEFDDVDEGDWWTFGDADKMTSEIGLEAVTGMERNLGACYGVDTTGLNGVKNVGNHRHCPLNFGVGNLLNTQKEGAESKKRYLGKERVVYYKPNEDFEGVDHFTFSSLIGQQEGDEVEVRINVRNCRRFFSDAKIGNFESTPSLCGCKRSEVDLFGSETLCPAEVRGVCGGVEGERYTNMCVLCKGTDFSIYTAECKIEIDRAVSMLESKGRCNGGGVPHGGVPDCSGESVSSSAREPFILYSNVDYTGSRGLVPVRG